MKMNRIATIKVHPFVGWTMDKVQRGDLTPLEGEDRLREQELPEEQVHLYLQWVKEAV